MIQIKRIQSEEFLKILGNPTRLAILRLLISKPATISQLGEMLNKHPAQIRNHIKQLEKAELVRLISVLPVRNYLEKYYQATARAYFVNMAVFPVPSERGQIFILGSDDRALELLAEHMERREGAPLLYVLPVGSLDGLIYLRENYCQISGCHLFDMESGEYNQPYVRHLFTDQAMVLVTLAYRRQGLMVRKGNPLGLTGIVDMAREDVTIINRKKGTGTRLWLDQQLKHMGLDSSKINGYASDALTHAEVANAVAGGWADTGLGIYAAAEKVNLDFIPLFSERYDLVMAEAFFKSADFLPVMETLHSADFRRAVEKLGGYNTSHTGEVLRV
jgi:putative molybdopterin biosynthesis protein